VKFPFPFLRYDVGHGVTDASAVRVNMMRKDAGEESAARPGFEWGHKVSSLDPTRAICNSM
jgi:hypothetical protein